MTVWRFQRRQRSCLHDVLCHVPKGGKKPLVALPSDYTVNEILTTYSQAPNIQHLHNRLVAGIAALPFRSWISCRRWGFPSHMRLMNSHRCSKKRQDSVRSLPRLIAVESQRDELKQLLRHQNDQIKIREKKEDYSLRPEVQIHIPDILKALLVDDWENVTKDKSLVLLPCEHPVDEILTTYFEEEKHKYCPGSAEAVQ